MAITDAARNHLFNTLRETLGAEDADTMMDLLPPVGWADVARQSDLDRLASVMEARFARLEDRMDRFEVAMREQTRFFVTCLFAGNAAVIAVVGLLVR